MAYGLITTGSLLKGFFEKKKDRPNIPYGKALALARQKDDPLKAREDLRSANIARGARASLQKKIRGKKAMVARAGQMPKTVMTTPKAQAKEREFYQRNIKDKLKSHPWDSGLPHVEAKTSPLEKRCVSDVVKKGKTVSQAYAICRASLQKSGRIEKGGMELTKLGKAISNMKSRKSDHATKLKSWKKAIVKARKSQ